MLYKSSGGFAGDERSLKTLSEEERDMNGLSPYLYINKYTN